MPSKSSRSILNSARVKRDFADDIDDIDEHSNMPTYGETSSGSGVPAFLTKLWRLVDDPETDNLICWSQEGRSFFIQNQAQFARELLPLNYKHNNMASFIRQLNMYGFHKITSIENGGLRFDRDEIEFSHPCFKRSYPYLLDHIKRKISNSKNVDEKSALKQETVSKVLSDVKAMRGRQDTLDSRFSVMKQENEALWREIASLRQKHAKQQQIVNKLIQFLISIVQPTRNMSGVRRHMQLMINDTPESTRTRTTSEAESDCGPVIHELSEELLDEVMNPREYDATKYENESVSPQALERPRSNASVSSFSYDHSNQCADDLVKSVANFSPETALTSSATPPSSILYTVTEAPDSHVSELPKSPMSEDANILTTPMVREQEARNRQLLKQKNKERRDAAKTEPVQTSSPIKAQRSPSGIKPQIVIKSSPVKTEPKRKITNPQNFVPIEAPALVSPKPDMPELLDTNDSDLYNVNFISNDIPTDIFENATLLPDVDNGAIDSTSKSEKLNQQQQFGASTVNNGKFANIPIDFDGASTSAAATTSRSSLLSDVNMASTSKAAAAANNNDEAMAITKYTGDNNNQNNLRLSTVSVTEPTTLGYEIEANNNIVPMSYYNYSDEVNGHLDNVQDELDTLKDLLRADNVSIDQNMLLGSVQRGADFSATSRMSALMPNLQLTDEELLLKLFNDSDLMDTYPFNFPNDNGDKKNSGSELMAYQPGLYDLNDFLNSDESSNKNEPDSTNAAYQSTGSELNTPCHE